MKANKKIMPFLILFLVLSALTFLLFGCTLPQGPIEVFALSDPAQTPRSNPVEKRFKEPAQRGPTPVESVVELSKKYAKVSEEATALRQKNQDFVAENQQLKDQIAVFNAQLQQTQKELTEANDLLIEMRVELNNWKADILGFRGEMRDAEKAQLEALLKILKVLGGEVREKPAQGESAGSATRPQSEPARPTSLKMPISGETNE